MPGSADTGPFKRHRTWVGRVGLKRRGPGKPACLKKEGLKTKTGNKKRQTFREKSGSAQWRGRPSTAGKERKRSPSSLFPLSPIKSTRE